MWCGVGSIHGFVLVELSPPRFWCADNNVGLMYAQPYYYILLNVELHYHTSEGDGLLSRGIEPLALYINNINNIGLELYPLES